MADYEYTTATPPETTNALMTALALAGESGTPECAINTNVFVRTTTLTEGQVTAIVEAVCADAVLL